MKSLIPESLTHRGTVLAEGFLFSMDLLPENEIRRRILSVWQSNTKVFRHEDKLIVICPKPFRVNCRSVFGLPLVRYGKILSSLPLCKKDLEQFEDFGETILYLAGGELNTLPVEKLKTENIENWFDVASFEVIETQSLGEIKTKPVDMGKAAEIDIRTALKNVPDADVEMFEVLKSLKEKTEVLKDSKTKSGAQNGAAPGATNSPGILTSAGTFFSSIFNSLSSLFSSKPGKSRVLSRPGQSSGKTGQYSRPQGSARGAEQSSNPPAPSKFFNRLRQFFAKALFQLKLARIFGKQQAKYLAKMMEMFESGDLKEALKYAIPLENLQELKQIMEKTPFMGKLRPREELKINYNRSAPSNSSVFLEDNWFNDLRELYQQTFDRLVAQHRIEEAAFVLAELLKNNAEAVEFLEKHGKFRLAAELAEARNLPKEVVVRQWFIADEKKRAIQLAVRHNCFEYVVTKLEQQNHPQAAELRELWAENLATAGNYTAAVNVIWPLEARRAKAKKWIDQVIEFGGAAAGEMLAKKASHFPETFNEINLKFQEFIMENSRDADEKRIAFAKEIFRLQPNNELRILARPLARKILAGMAKDDRHFTGQDFRQLVEMTGDYSLRTDLPALPQNTEAKKFDTLIIEIEENNRGTGPVYDACLLPDGKLAVALGEAGVKILSKKGVTLAHFDQPTQKFIVSDFGTRAIGLIKRDSSYRLTKFDFINRRAEYWCEAGIQNFAPTFDGNLWFAGDRDEVYAIDTNAKDFESVWRVSDLGGVIYEITRSATRLTLLVNMNGGITERWRYDLPELILRRRNEIKSWYETKNENQYITDMSTGIVHSVIIKQEVREDSSTGFEAEVFDYETRIAKFEFPPDTVAVRKPQLIERSYALVRQTKDDTIIELYEIPNSLLASVHLKKMLLANVRLDEKNLTVTDEFGRVIVFEHKEKRLEKEHTLINISKNIVL